MEREDNSIYLKEYNKAKKRIDKNISITDLLIAFTNSINTDLFKDLQESTLNNKEMAIRKIKLILKNINMNNLF